MKLDKKFPIIFFILILSFTLFFSINTLAAAEDTVAISDTALKNKLIKICGITNGTIKEKNLTALTSLDLSNDDDYDDEDKSIVITDLSGLNKAVNLTSLNLNNNEIASLSPISSLKNLKVLSINNNKLKNLEFINSFSNLIELNANDNKFDKIANLATLTKLQVLRLQGNSSITDTSVLKSLTNLTNLNLAYTNLSTTDNLLYLPKLKALCLNGTDLTNYSMNIISKIPTIEYLYLADEASLTDISPLSKLTRLYELDLSNNNIADITPLSKFSSLGYLNLSNNKISTISTISNLKNLTQLILNNNSIENADALSSCNKLKELYLQYNKLSNFSAATNIINIEILYLNNNSIENINNVSNLTKLKRLNISDNKISSLAPLKNLKNLIVLSAANNSITSISDLSALTSLKDLNLNNNKITDVSSIYTCKELVSLFISKNSISNISGFSNFSKLSVLYITDNSISDISALKNLPLTLLHINNNVLDLSAGSATTSILTSLQNKGCSVVSSGQSISTISLNRSLVNIYLNETYQLTASFTNNPADKTVTWSSSNNSAVTVSSSGLVKTVGKGFAVITAKAANGHTASCTVTSLVKEFVSMRLNRKNALVNDTITAIDSAGVTPIMANSVSMIPIRFTSERLGASVEWIDATHTIFLIKDTIKLELKLGSNVMKKYVTQNGTTSTSTITLQAAPYLYQTRTMLPLRAVSEGFGFEVFWDDPSHVIVVCNFPMTDAERTTQINSAKSKLP